MIKKYSKIILINLIVIVVLVELISMIFIKAKGVSVPDYDKIPTYLDIIFDKDKTFKGVLYGSGDSIMLDPLSPRNIDTLYPWCTWHPLNRTHREIFPCFDVMYKFNEIGTRGSLPNPMIQIPFYLLVTVMLRVLGSKKTALFLKGKNKACTGRF